MGTTTSDTTACSNDFLKISLTQFPAKVCSHHPDKDKAPPDTLSLIDQIGSPALHPFLHFWHLGALMLHTTSAPIGKN
ncbi:hypothetical protein Pelo_1712 [Pelomyxa schiedti]|nr:hypothetical protein Pelo_1712 [Pelomyxa schiedti]